jgi:hypothetical protein
MKFAAWVRALGTTRAAAVGVVVVAVCAALIWIACDDDPQDPGETSDGPPPPSLTDPIWEYPRSEGQSITGGYVYRGPTIAPLAGKYVYADHLTRHVWALSYDDSVATNEFLVDAPNRVSAFGVAEDGELFLCGYNATAATKIRGLSESGGVYTTTDAFPNLTFNKPVDLRNAGDGSDRLFAVEQAGIIRVFDNDAAAAASLEFLNISGSVVCCGELGLLGLVFHPDYETNGYFFVFYTTSGGTPRRDRLSRFRVSAGDPNAADVSSEVVLIEFDDDFDNHNGGGLCFGDDGYLYVSTGDEGDGGDPHNNAQNRASWFGKILRIDVDQNVGVAPYYGVPPDNPLVGNTSGYREEIFAWGFRNPWRIAFDSPTDRLWVADVGQNSYEEIDIVEIGKNYGWDCREGMHDYLGDPSPACP